MAQFLFWMLIALAISIRIERWEGYLRRMADRVDPPQEDETRKMHESLEFLASLRH